MLSADWQGLKIVFLTSVCGAPLLYLVTGFVRLTLLAFKSNSDTTREIAGGANRSARRDPTGPPLLLAHQEG